MPSFNAWDIVRVPFPYTDRPIRKYRPALVVVGGDLDKSHGLLWLLMITSAENCRWPDDVPISNIEAAGLPIPSVVRCAKIATVDAHSAERLGMLPRGDRTKVKRYLQNRLRHLL